MGVVEVWNSRQRHSEWKEISEDELRLLVCELIYHLAVRDGLDPLDEVHLIRGAFEGGQEEWPEMRDNLEIWLGKTS